MPRAAAAGLSLGDPHGVPTGRPVEGAAGGLAAAAGGAEVEKVGSLGAERLAA